MEQLLNAGECPVCHRICGKLAPRQAVMAHIRNAKDTSHTTWKHMHPFKRGLPVAARCTEEDVVRALTAGWDADRRAAFLRAAPACGTQPCF